MFNSIIKESIKYLKHIINMHPCAYLNYYLNYCWNRISENLKRFQILFGHYYAFLFRKLQTNNQTKCVYKEQTIQ